MNDDLISRQAAIEVVSHAWAKGLEPTQFIEELPSAEPERKKGKWMHDKDDELVSGYCSFCGWTANIMETDVADMPFCPNCGADMQI